MFRAFKALGPVSVLTLLVACADSGSSASGGLSSLSSVTPEAPGTACPAGGMRIATGVDANENGLLDKDEEKSSQFACNGTNGKDGTSGTNGTDGTNGKDGANGSGVPQLLEIGAEAAGSNCTAGGTKITAGPDTNGNGTLDASEVTTTRFVCNGTGTSTASPDAVSQYKESNVNVGSTSSVTILSAQIAAPAAGKVVAIGSADTFCASPALGSGYDCNNSGNTTGYWSLSTDANADANGGSYDYFYVSPNATENTSRTSVFSVGGAGTVTVYLRAKTAGAGQYGFFRTSLTLLYLP